MVKSTNHEIIASEKIVYSQFPTDGGKPHSSGGGAQGDVPKLVRGNGNLGKRGCLEDLLFFL